MGGRCKYGRYCGERALGLSSVTSANSEMKDFKISKIDQLLKARGKYGI